VLFKGCISGMLSPSISCDRLRISTRGLRHGSPAFILRDGSTSSDLSAITKSIPVHAGYLVTTCAAAPDEDINLVT
jgi:hypothetical protein